MVHLTEGVPPAFVLTLLASVAPPEVRWACGDLSGSHGSNSKSYQSDSLQSLSLDNKAQVFFLAVY